MSLVLASSGGGSITLQEPVTASNRTMTLPDAAGTVALTTDVVGVGQTWQDVKASRATGTSYQNTTAGPIEVFISTDSTANALIQVSSNNSTWVTLGISQTAKASHSFVVPKNWYYRVSGSTTLTYWSELR